MKKAIKRILSVFLFISCICFLMHALSCNIYAYDEGDPCPNSSDPTGVAGCNGHLVIDVVVSPTCAREGMGNLVCDTCGNIFDQGVTIPKTAHNYVKDYADEPTCTSTGTQYYKCNVCGNSTSETIPALGHNYDDEVTKEPTCLEKGTRLYTCKRCGGTKTGDIDPLGHDYVSKITTEATCENEGVRTYTCSRCKKSYTEKITALGHDYVHEDKEATCAEDGYSKDVCSRCKKEQDVTTYKALGHDVTFKVDKQATCIENGSESGVCTRCNETITNVLPALGHKYPDEWTTEKKATIFSEGLESKTCETCGDVETQVIPKADATPVVVGTGATLAAAAVGIYFGVIKPKTAAKIIEAAKDVAVEEAVEKLLPSIESRTIVSCSDNKDFITFLKAQRYIQMISTSIEELDECVEENEPDLIIADILDEEKYNDFIENLDEENKYSLLISADILENKKEELDNLIKEEKLVAYCDIETNNYVKLVKLVLPICKPSLTSDEGLENIGMVADALGIPFISTITNLYESGREIKETIQEGELGVSETSTIIGDIASILGLDKIGSVTDLIDDVYTIKDTIRSQKGTYDVAEGVDASKDIVDIVSDVSEVLKK